MTTHAETRYRGGPEVSALICIGLCVGMLAAAGVALGRDDAAPHPAVPGVLHVADLDTTELRAPVVDTTTGARSWSWDWGALTAFDESVRVIVDEQGLSLTYGIDLGGVSRGRRLLFVNGEYPVDGPLLLADSHFQLFVSRGTLEIGPGHLRLSLEEEAAHPAAQYLLFLGVLLITLFMMLKTRARLKKT